MEKIAVIDIGSNSARIVFAHVLDSGHYVVFDEMKESVRLGQDLDSNGVLKKSRTDMAISTLKMFKRMCDVYCIDKVYAFATNAIRRAVNQRSFLEEVYASCGFRVKVLSEHDEAQYIYYGVVNHLEIAKGVLVDISGSSFQLIHYNRRSILDSVNLPFGTMSLTELAESQGLYKQEQALFVEQYTREAFEKIGWLKTLDPEVVFVGVGGAFRNIARISMRMSRYPLEMLHNYSLSNTDLCSIYDMVKVLDTSKRATIKGLSSGRADIFCSALAGAKSLMSVANINAFIISSCGLREGVLINHANSSVAEKSVNDILQYSIQSKLWQTTNSAHAEQVNALAMVLYKELRVLHKLPRYYVKVLKIAALLHDVGKQVRSYDYQKHGGYFVLNCGVCGATHRELVLASFVVAAHKDIDINMTEWQKYKDIVEAEDLSAVYKLGMLLKLAKALDRSMAKKIRGLECDILGESVVMKTQQMGDSTLEVREALNCGADFARVFKKNIEIL